MTDERLERMQRAGFRVLASGPGHTGNACSTGEITAFILAVQKAPRTGALFLRNGARRL